MLPCSPFCDQSAMLVESSCGWPAACVLHQILAQPHLAQCAWCQPCKSRPPYQLAVILCRMGLECLRMRACCKLMDNTRTRA